MKYNVIQCAVLTFGVKHIALCRTANDFSLAHRNVLCLSRSFVDASCMTRVSDECEAGCHSYNRRWRRCSSSRST